MKIFVLLNVLLLIMACSTKPTRIDSLSIPDEGFQLVQHTHNLKERERNSLYKPSRKIEQHEFGSNGLINFINNLRAKMHEAHGIGIAANQVNRNLQIFLLEAVKTDRWHEGLDSVPYQVFINPKIIGASKEKRNFWHGCLSGWGEKLGNAASYDWIEYEAFDEYGQIKAGRLEGLAAVIFQHELRHLLGGTYLDKAEEFIDSAELYVKSKENEITFFGKADDDLPLLLDDYIIGESLEDYYKRDIKL